MKIVNLFSKLIFGLILLVQIDSFAQEPRRDSLYNIDTSLERIKDHHLEAVFIEYAGNSGFLSLNFDLRYQKHYAFRVGVGFYSNGQSDASDPNIILFNPEVVTMVNYLFFNTEFQIETGIGMITDLSSRYCGGILPNNCSRIKPTLFFGFRFQPYLESYIVRFGYTPFFDLHDYLNFFGITFGYSFD